MKSDIEIQKDVLDELKWEATINAVKPTEIGVTVRNGVVTLTGTLDSYSKKLATERAAMRVAGVKAVADELEVKPLSSFKKTDTEIAEAVLHAIKWSTSIPEDKIKVKVEDGWVTLQGNVSWEFQKKSATKVVDDLKGVVGVINMIEVVPQLPTPTASQVKSKILSAFHRNATLDADKIKVEVNASKITLTGTVRSLAEKKDAENAAWSTPGIIEVDNKLEISYLLNRAKSTIELSV